LRLRCPPDAQGQIRRKTGTQSHGALTVGRVAAIDNRKIEEPPMCRAHQPPPLPHLGDLSLRELDDLIHHLVDWELEASRVRRTLHAQLDTVWAERQNRAP
jgi:hypothetical protein